MTPKAAKKVKAIIRRLSTSSESERAACVAALSRVLESNGLTFNDLAGLMIVPYRQAPRQPMRLPKPSRAHFLFVAFVMCGLLFAAGLAIKPPLACGVAFGFLLILSICQRAWRLSVELVCSAWICAMMLVFVRLLVPLG